MFDYCLSPHLDYKLHQGKECVSCFAIPRSTPFAQCLTPQQVLIKYMNSFNMKEKLHRLTVTKESQFVHCSYCKGDVGCFRSVSFLCL